MKTRKPPPQFTLKLVLSATAVVAYHMALFSNLLHGSLAGFTATLFAHAMVWLAIALYRMRLWPDLFEAGS
ncbi:MAG: hypothetical protein ACREHD_05340 [Pirellulales bacterium]